MGTNRRATKAENSKPNQRQTMLQHKKTKQEEDYLVRTECNMLNTVANPRSGGIRRGCPATNSRPKEAEVKKKWKMGRKGTVVVSGKQKEEDEETRGLYRPARPSLAIRSSIKV